MIDQLLEGYQPTEIDELEYRSTMLEIAARGDMTSRTQFSPGHFTASAFVVHPHRPEVALIHHAKIDLWVQPGGHIDPGETPDRAARREVAEEIGLVGLDRICASLFDIDIHTFPGGVSGDPEHLHLDLRFAYRAVSAELAPNGEVKDAVWVPIEPPYPGALDRSVTRPMSKLRALLEQG